MAILLPPTTNPVPMIAQDSRSTRAAFTRGRNVYNGGSYSANKGMQLTARKRASTIIQKPEDVTTQTPNNYGRDIPIDQSFNDGLDPNGPSRYLNYTPTAPANTNTSSLYDPANTRTAATTATSSTDNNRTAATSATSTETTTRGTTTTPTTTSPTTTATTAPTVPATVGLSGNTQADFDYQTALNNIFRDTSSLDSEAKLAVDRSKSDLTKSFEEAARTYGKTKTQSTSRFANNGMLFSGGYVANQADIGEAYNRDVNNLTTQAQRTFEDVSRATAARKLALEQQRLEVERQQAAAKAAEDLRKALVQAQTEAYSSVMNAISSSNMLYDPSAGTSKSNPYYTSGGNVIHAYARDPVTGGTLFRNGQPVYAEDE